MSLAPRLCLSALAFSVLTLFSGSSLHGDPNISRHTSCHFKPRGKGVSYPVSPPKTDFSVLSLVAWSSPKQGDGICSLISAVYSPKAGG